MHAIFIYERSPGRLTLSFVKSDYVRDNVSLVTVLSWNSVVKWMYSSSGGKGETLEGPAKVSSSVETPLREASPGDDPISGAVTREVVWPRPLKKNLRREDLRMRYQRGTDKLDKSVGIPRSLRASAALMSRPCWLERSPKTEILSMRDQRDSVNELDPGESLPEGGDGFTIGPRGCAAGLDATQFLGKFSLQSSQALWYNLATEQRIRLHITDGGQVNTYTNPRIP